MTKAVFLAVAALVSGILAVVACDRLFPPEMNYRTISVLGEAFRAFLFGSFRFAMGAFAGLALSAGLTSAGGGGARRPGALVLAALLAVAVIGVSGYVFRGATGFPAGGALEVRHRWAEGRLGRPYRAVAEWVAAAPAVRAACGETLRVGPAAGERNVILVGSGEVTVALTLDVEGERGNGRLSVGAVLPSASADSGPVVRSAALEQGGRRTALDSAGNALGSAP